MKIWKTKSQKKLLICTEIRPLACTLSVSSLFESNICTHRALGTEV